MQGPVQINCIFTTTWPIRATAAKLIQTGAPCLSSWLGHQSGWGWQSGRWVSILIKQREKRNGQQERRREQERQLDCVLLCLWEMSQVETSFPRQLWNTPSSSEDGEGLQTNILTHPFFTPANTHTAALMLSVSRVFRYTLAGKQFHKLTYKVETVRADTNKQTLQADCLLQLTL